MNKARYKQLSPLFRKEKIEALNYECSHAEWDAFMFLLFRQGEDMLVTRQNLVGLTPWERVVNTVSHAVYSKWDRLNWQRINVNSFTCDYACKHERNFGA